ncbi:MAG: YggT family protein [Gemmatimonadaceae bacterium]
MAFSAFAAALAALRIAFFVLAAIAAVICLLDWLVRTRRIGQFSPLARFLRRYVDPLMRPVENRIVRAGGSPSSAPWWTLVAIVVGGIVILTLLEFLGEQIFVLAASTRAGGSGLFRVLVSWTFGVLKIALIVRVISSWFRISEYSKWIRWAVVLTEPILRPLRNVIPPLGMIDITPLVAYFILWLLQGFLMGML